MYFLAFDCDVKLKYLNRCVLKNVQLATSDIIHHEVPMHTVNVEDIQYGNVAYVDPNEHDHDVLGPQALILRGGAKP